MLFATVIVLAGRIVLAQQGMGHSNMGSMGMMDHGVMIPPDLAENPAVQAHAAALNKGWPT